MQEPWKQKVLSSYLYGPGRMPRAVTKQLHVTSWEEKGLAIYSIIVIEDNRVVISW